MNYEKEIRNFLKKSGDKEKIIVIYGPTASGKTSLSIDIAIMLESEIISADSRQIFRFLDIGTGKIKESEKNGITHHMIDIITPEKEYSVGEYKREAKEIIKSLHKQWKIPIIAWGTGLYIDSLIYDFDIPKVPADKDLRAKLEKEAEELGNDFIYQKLCKLDPEYAQTLHPNNRAYIIRALEVKLLSGKSKSTFKKEKILSYDTFFLTPYDGNREALYEKIDTRVDAMWKEGLINEVKNILKKWYAKNAFWLKTIGYKEIIDFLEGHISEEEAKELIKKHSRNYAKRQLTWFRRYEENK